MIKLYREVKMEFMRVLRIFPVNTNLFILGFGTEA